MFNNTSKITKNFFDNTYVRDDLKNKAVNSGSISVVTRVVSTMIQIGGLIVLARILSPADYGLVTMATVVSNFFFVFQELGLADATIQATGIKHEQVSTLFWINLAFGFLIMMILIVLSPAVAWIYKRPQVTLIMMISSLGFIFTGLYTQHIAILKRNMQFVRVSLIEILSSLISIMASIAFALLGWRYWAIVVRPILFGLITTILAWIFCLWRPGRPIKNSGVRPLLKFGANSVGFSILNYFAANLDKMLIGKKYGAEQLGYYSRAYYLSSTPTGQLTLSLFHVAVSTLSKLREEPENYRKYYLSAISIITFLGMPISIFMVIMNKELVYLLLGGQWNQVSEIFAILGLSAGLNIIYNTIGWLHVSLGRTDRWLKWGIIGSLAMVVGFLLGLPFGPRGVASAYTLVIILITFPGILYAGKPIGLRFHEVFSTIWRYTGASVLAGAVIVSIKSLFVPKVPIIWIMIFSLVAFFLTYLVFVAIIYWSVKPIADFVVLFKNIVYKMLSRNKSD